MPSPPPTSITVAASVSSPSLDLISTFEACRGAPKEGRIGSPWQTTCSAVKPRLRAWAATSLVATKHLSTSCESKWNIAHWNQSKFYLMEPGRVTPREVSHNCCKRNVHEMWSTRPTYYVQLSAKCQRFEKRELNYGTHWYMLHQWVHTHDQVWIYFSECSSEISCHNGCISLRNH